MQRIRAKIFIAPLFPALFMAVWAGISTRNLQIDWQLETIAIGFFMWAFAGELSLFIFGLPLLLVIRRLVKINIYYAVLVSVVSAILMTAIITYVVPDRVPWHVAFINMSSVNIPCGILGGIALWYVGFRNK